MNKILLVDDDREIIEFLTYNFEKNHFSVAKAANGREAITKAKEFLPDVILMDMMMPEMDGVEACQVIRAHPKLSNSIIIMVSARTEDYSIIAGLESGADDYVVKPVKFRILLKKIEAHLFRYNKNQKIVFEEVYEDEVIRVNRMTHQCWYMGVEIELANKEFELISLLTSNPEKVFTREEILEKAWSLDAFVGERTIDVHIRRLRSKFSSDIIKTVSGIGYKYIPQKS